jgi:hypothetical protein
VLLDILSKLSQKWAEDKVETQRLRLDLTNMIRAKFQEVEGVMEDPEQSQLV